MLTQQQSQIINTHIFVLIIALRLQSSVSVQSTERLFALNEYVALTI